MLASNGEAVALLRDHLCVSMRGKQHFAFVDLGVGCIENRLLFRHGSSVAANSENMAFGVFSLASRSK